MPVHYSSTYATQHPRSPARAWLLIQGFVLLAFGVLGLVPSVYNALHGLSIHLEHGEDAIHWVLGVVSLLLGLAIRRARVAAVFAILFGVSYLLIGVLGFLVPDAGAWHVGVGDNVLHLAFGLVSFAAAIATSRRSERRQDYLRRQHAV